MKTNLKNIFTMVLVSVSMSFLFQGLSPAHADGDGSPYDYQGSVGLKDVDGATEIALRAMELVNELQGSSDYAELGRYLLPIKKAAAQAYAVARARDEFSLELRNAMTVLQRTIHAADPYLEQTLERADIFDTATELMTLEDQIQAILE